MNENILKYKGVEPRPNTEVLGFLQDIDYSKFESKLRFMRLLLKQW